MALRVICLLLVSCLCLSAQPTPQTDPNIQLARKHLRENRLSQAIDLYERLLKKYPGRPRLLIELALACFKAGRYPCTVEAASSAIELESVNPLGWLFLGAAYYEMGLYQKAEPPLRRAHELRPTDRNATLMLAETLLATGKYLPALKLLLGLNRKQLAAHVQARIWAGLRKAYRSLARQMLERAKTKFPDDLWTAALKAEWAYQEGQRAEAERLAARLTAHSIGLSWKAPPEAKPQRLKATACPHQMPQCLYQQGATVTLLELGAQSSATSEQLYWAGRLALEKARQALEKLRQSPSSVALQALLAEEAYERALFRQAAEHWKNVLRVQPSNYRAAVKLAWSYYQAGDLEKALQTIEPLLARFPNCCAELYFLKGAVFLEQQLPEKAVPLLERAVHIAPEWLPARKALGLSLLRMGKAKEAIAQLHFVLERVPTDFTVRYQLAQAYRAIGQAEKALELLKSRPQVASGKPSP